MLVGLELTFEVTDKERRGGHFAKVTPFLAHFSRSWPSSISANTTATSLDLSTRDYPDDFCPCHHHHHHPWPADRSMLQQTTSSFTLGITIQVFFVLSTLKTVVSEDQKKKRMKIKGAMTELYKILILLRNGAHLGSRKNHLADTNEYVYDTNKYV